MSDIDPELTKLLNSVDETGLEPADTPAEPVVEPVVEPVSTAIVPTVPDPPMVPGQSIAVVVPPSDLMEEAASQDTLGIKKLLESFISKAQVIIDNHTADRAQIEDAITYFANEVKAAQQAQIRLPQAFVEGWVKLLATKAEINSNATSVLDAMAKLLAAAKNNNIILNVSGGNAPGGLDIEALLSKPSEGDEIDGVL